MDLTPQLLAVASERAKAAGFNDIQFCEGDAEALPFEDASFGVVLSTCGHMFAPNQPKVAAELARVTRSGGRVVFLAWTPDGGLGGWFRITNKYLPPPPDLASPFNWGDPEKVNNYSEIRLRISHLAVVTVRNLATLLKVSGSCSPHDMVQRCER